MYVVSGVAVPTRPPTLTIDGRQMYIDCRGTGSPSVVFESGYGGGVDDWSEVFDLGVSTPRMCAYDRAGIGWSDPWMDLERFTPADVVSDLHALLLAANVPPPYVLVGHSLGGLFLPVFAATYPSETAALILVDPSSLWQISGRQFKTFGSDWTQLSQGAVPFDLSVARSQLRTALPVQVPLLVLTAGDNADGPSYQDRSWLADHDRLVEQATGSAVHILVPDTGHYIQTEDPRLTLAVIHWVIEAVPSGSMPACRSIAHGLDVECRS
jgi:pimeloyl-ACP methyl ester carboxylesterase